MNIGSLYKINRYYWLLYSSKEITAKLYSFAELSDDANIANRNSAFWSKLYDCEITCFPPETIFVLLEKDGNVKKILTKEGKIGWIGFNENFFSSFEEVK